MSIIESNFSHVVVICSRDRKESLLKSIRSILDQDPKVNLRAITLVVNFELDDDYRYLAENLKRVDFNNFRVIRTSHGLPSARNLALSSLEDVDVVHFIDDDVLVGNNYFHDIDIFLQKYPNASGGAPIQYQEGSRNNHSSGYRIKKYLGIEPEVGIVSTSMRNTWGVVADLEPFKVDWLPGLAMFYRKSAIEGSCFQENLETFSLGGYGLGEDLVFTLNLTQSGKSLFAIPSLIVNHTSLPNAANKSSGVFYAQGELKRELIKVFPKRFSKTKYLCSLFFECLFLVVRKPKAFRYHVNSLFTELKGFFKKE